MKKTIFAFLVCFLLGSCGVNGREEFVGDISIGVGIDIGNLELIYSDTYRGKEFMV